MSELSIAIITPGWDDDLVTTELRSLTKAICELDAAGQHFFGLCGEWGYGEDFENDVFVMRRFYWGDCDCGADERRDLFFSTDAGHAADCYQTAMKRRIKNSRLKSEQRIYKDLAKNLGLPEYGCAVHCTCEREKRIAAADIGHRAKCSLKLPNFYHKTSGIEVRWYKWIGRDNKIKAPDGADVVGAVRESRASIR